MKRVYICSPLRGDVQDNMQRARAYCQYAIKCGVMPIAPHIYFTQFLDDTISAQREMGIRAGLELLSDCKELWIFGDRITQGMRDEIDQACGLGMNVRYMDSEEIEINNLNGGMKFD